MRGRSILRPASEGIWVLSRLGRLLKNTSGRSNISNAPARSTAQFPGAASMLPDWLRLQQRLDASDKLRVHPVPIADDFLDHLAVTVDDVGLRDLERAVAGAEVGFGI